MRRHLLLCAAAALALAGGAEAAAQDPGSSLRQQVGEWRIGPIGRSHCSAARSYPDGTELFVSASGDYEGLSLLKRDRFLSGKGRYFTVDGRRVPSDPLGEAQTPRGLSLLGAPGVVALLAAGKVFELHAADGSVIDRVELTGAAEAIAAMRRCAASPEAAAYAPPAPPAPPPPPPPPPPVRKGKERIARPLRPPYTLLTDADYPAAAMRAGEQGTVGFRLDVDTAGRVAACTIVSSSNSAALDAATCRLMTMRLRFEPARNRKGKAVPGAFFGRILWRIADPAPTPPPPTP